MPSVYGSKVLSAAAVNRANRVKARHTKKIIDTLLGDTTMEADIVQEDCIEDASIELEEFAFIDVSKCEKCDILKAQVEDFSTEM